MRYLAIDYGIKRTGLAVCDAGERIASPLTVVQGRKDLIPRIKNIVATDGIEALVLGLPLNMDGTEGPQAKLVRTFGDELGRQLGIPVFFQDERLSSFEAEQRLREMDLSRTKRKARLDALAAADILQSFLDRKAGR
ncbi:MAG TPA: Holliday junction resolvase RuvX [Sedimentisphaerales bacterium]|nr:Holliday junction resolvase RuvX [Sedimentisphaerales bacterium]HQI27383.1 Holliday junction resolvase RuvX [Sedimentisphaerales bacterium]